MTFAVVNGQRVPIDDEAAKPASLIDLATEAAKGWLSGVNPGPALKAMYDSASGHYTAAEQAAKDGRFADVIKQSVAASLAPPAALAKGAALAQWAQFQKARQAYRDGQLSEAAGHTLAAVLPFLGPMAAQSGEAIGSGDPRTMARGVGVGAAALTPAAVKYGTEVARTGSLAPTPADVATAPPLRASVPALMPNRNPAEADAVAFAGERGIPVDAGTATGNPAVRGVRYLADRSLGGSLVNAAQAPRQAAAFSRVGSELADATHPSAIQPTEAGADVRGAVASMRDQFDAQADAAYDRLRTFEADPNLAERMPTAPPATGRLESMGLPVDVRLPKKMLRPIYDQMARQMPLTQRQASPGLQAIGNILDGPDYAPLSQVDRDLSTIKSIARSQGGLAKLAVQRLDGAVREAAERGGPDVLRALEEGRAATAAKYGAEAVLDKLRLEPRQTFDQLTSAKDSAIEQLRAVRELAPQEMPKIGRAYLEDLLQTATAEGGFSRGQGLFAKWQRLGPQTKQILFGNPGLVADLDRFFLLAKKVGENPNPSGTGANVALLAQGSLLLTNPVTGLATQVGAATLAKLLHSQLFVRALTKGLHVPIGATGTAGAVTSEILAAAKSAGVVLPMAAERQPPTPATTERR